MTKALTGEEKEKRILHHLNLYLNLENADLKTVAKESGWSHSVVYNDIKSAEELYPELYEKAMVRLAQKSKEKYSKAARSAHKKSLYAGQFYS